MGKSGKKLTKIRKSCKKRKKNGKTQKGGNEENCKKREN